jgi:capsular polysaccharide biosynthesis protein
MLRTGPLLALVVGVVVATVMGLAGEYSTLRGPTVWTSRTMMLVDQPYGIAVAGDQGLLLKLESVRLKYQGLAATNAIAGPVAAKLGLPVAAVEATTTVQLPADSLILEVYGQWSSPGEAQRLSAAVASQISTFVQSEAAQYKIPAADQFTITVVDSASPGVPSGPSHSKAATVALGLAVAGFVLGFVLTQLVRNRRLTT